MEKINQLSHEEQGILRFLYNNTRKNEVCKKYFKSPEKFSVLARLKKEGYITHLEFCEKGLVNSVLLSSEVNNYFKERENNIFF